MGPGADVWAVGESGFVGRRAPETATWCWCAPAPPATLRGIWGASDQALFDRPPAQAPAIPVHP